MSFRRLLRYSVSIVFIVVLSACGGENSSVVLRMTTASVSIEPVPANLALSTKTYTVKRALSAQAPEANSDTPYMASAEEVFNWAEDAFSHLFGSYQETREYPPYKYRFYPATALYLVSDGISIFVMGEDTKWMLARVGLLSDFTALIVDARSKTKSGAVSSIPMAKQTWDKFWKTADPLDLMYRNGVGWYKASFTINSSNTLRETPSSKWSSLLWNNSYWGSVELSGEQLLRAQSRGMKVVPWFFLSDTPQDAGRNSSPHAWKSLDLGQTASALESAAFELTAYLVSKGLRPDFYQLGAETDKGMLDFVLGSKIPYPKDNFFFNTDYMSNNVWKAQAVLLNSAIRGVKRADPKAKIGIQAGSMGATPNNSFLLAYIDALVKENVDFDFVGLSFPYHSGGSGAPQTLSNKVPYFQTSEYLNTISSIAKSRKKIYIGEFGYPNRNFALGDGGIFKGLADDGYPFNDYGQAMWIRAFMKHCNATPEIFACFYFYPEYFPGVEYGTNDILESQGLFIADGLPRLGLRELGRLR